MTELEFARMMKSVPALPTEYHRAILGHILIDNPHVDGTNFALAYGSVSRVPVDRIRTLTLRQLQIEFGMPAGLYVCAEPIAPKKADTVSVMAAGECLKKDGCRSPVACKGFGYCREYNL